MEVNESKIIFNFLGKNNIFAEYKILEIIMILIKLKLQFQIVYLAKIKKKEF